MITICLYLLTVSVVFECPIKLYSLVKVLPLVDQWILNTQLGGATNTVSVMKRTSLVAIIGEQCLSIFTDFMHYSFEANNLN